MILTQLPKKMTITIGMLKKTLKFKFILEFKNLKQIIDVVYVRFFQV